MMNMFYQKVVAWLFWLHEMDPMDALTYVGSNNSKMNVINVFAFDGDVLDRKNSHKF